MKRLSVLQEQALVRLASDWRWGIHANTARGLTRRGLVSIETVRLHNGRSIDLPMLTPVGQPIAHELRREAVDSGLNVFILSDELRRWNTRVFS